MDRTIKSNPVLDDGTLSPNNRYDTRLYPPSKKTTVPALSIIPQRMSKQYLDIARHFIRSQKKVQIQHESLRYTINISATNSC